MSSAKLNYKGSSLVANFFDKMGIQAEEDFPTERPDCRWNEYECSCMESADETSRSVSHCSVFFLSISVFIVLLVIARLHRRNSFAQIFKRPSRPLWPLSPRLLRAPIKGNSGITLNGELFLYSSQWRSFLVKNENSSSTVTGVIFLPCKCEYRSKKDLLIDCLK